MDVELKIKSIMSNDACRCHLNDIPIILSRFNFQKKFQIITIAGTNGKGTTVSMLEEIFISNNKKVISHISPHIFEFNERIAVDKKPVSNSVLLELLERLQELTVDYSLSYYQIAFLCCCLLTQKIKIDYLILEVGLGGRLDCANTLEPDITAITNISLDHCEILGDTVEKIGLEKAAIARYNTPLFLGSDMPDSVIEYANLIHAKVYNRRYAVTNHECFADSYNIAMGIAEMLNKKLSIQYIPNIENIRARARCFILKSDTINNNYIVVDVAHNEASVKHLLKFIRAKLPVYMEVNAIFGILGSKDLDSILSVSKKYVYSWNVIDLSNIDNRAMKIDCIKNEFKEQCVEIVSYHDSFSSIDFEKKDSINVIFGSFVMVGEFMKYYEKNH